MAGTLRSPEVLNAAIDALTADATLTTLTGAAKTFTHVPADTAAPYVIVLPGLEEGAFESFEDDTPRNVEIIVTCVSVYPGAKELTDITARVATVLMASTTWAGLSGLMAWRFVRATPTVASGGQDGRIVYERSVAVQVQVQ